MAKNYKEVTVINVNDNLGCLFGFCMQQIKNTIVVVEGCDNKCEVNSLYATARFGVVRQDRISALIKDYLIIFFYNFPGSRGKRNPGKLKTALTVHIILFKNVGF